MKYGAKRQHNKPTPKYVPPPPTAEDMARAAAAIAQNPDGQIDKPRAHPYGLATVKGDVRGVDVQHQPVENPTMPTLQADNWTAPFNPNDAYPNPLPLPHWCVGAHRRGPAGSLGERRHA